MSAMHRKPHNHHDDDDVKNMKESPSDETLADGDVSVLAGDFEMNGVSVQRV